MGSVHAKVVRILPIKVFYVEKIRSLFLPYCILNCHFPPISTIRTKSSPFNSLQLREVRRNLHAFDHIIGNYLPQKCYPCRKFNNIKRNNAQAMFLMIGDIRMSVIFAVQVKPYKIHRTKLSNFIAYVYARCFFVMIFYSFATCC